MTRASPLESLVKRFRDASLTREEWSHAAHLRVGAWHVDHLGADAGLVELREGIRRLNQALGTPNTATRGYHETITRAYVSLIAEFLKDCPPNTTRTERVELLLGSALSAPTLLERFWSRERLMSPRARVTWIEPDLARLELAAALRGPRQRA